MYAHEVEDVPRLLKVPDAHSDYLEDGFDRKDASERVVQLVENRLLRVAHAVPIETKNHTIADDHGDDEEVEERVGHEREHAVLHAQQTQEAAARLAALLAAGEVAVDELLWLRILVLNVCAHTNTPTHIRVHTLKSVKSQLRGHNKH